jgi:hypothetical protein
MATAHRYGNVSGLSLTEASFVGYRSNPHYGFDDRHMESWLLTTSGSLTPRLALRTPGRLGTPWRSPSSGVTFAPSFSGDVHIVFPPEGSDGQLEAPARVRTEELSGVLAGAWGLEDDLVFVWGDRWDDRGVRQNVMYRWDGRSFRQIAAPGPGMIFGLHGTRRDLVYAVGHGGLIARWDGDSWTRAWSPTGRVLGSVLVLDETRIYASGPRRQPPLLEGSLYGWTEMMRVPFAVSGLAMREQEGGAKELWIASYPGGLWKLEGGTKLTAVNEEISIVQMDARGDELVLTTEDEIIGTRDGQELRRIGLPIFMRLHEMYGARFELVGRGRR